VITIGDYRIGRLLGCGGFGKVFACTHVRTGEAYAMKIIERSFIEQQDIATYVKKEIEILRRLRHQHVVRFFKCIETIDGVHIVMELATHGELFDKIISSKKFEENIARKYFQQLIAAIYACHAMNICHRDLKAENLLLDGDDNLKVCDFGLGVVGDQRVRQHSVTGSTEYQLPEMLDPANHTGYDSRAADIWASGVILCFMLNGFLPFDGRNDSEIARKVMSSEPRLGDHISAGAKSLIQHILARSPSQRATLQDVIEHPWFRDGDLVCFESLFPNHIYSGENSPLCCSAHESSFMGSPFIPRVSSFDNAEPPAHNPHILRRAFEAMDLHHTQRLTSTDVRNVMLNLRRGECPSKEDVDEVMRFFDRKCRGYINYEDFMTGHMVKNFQSASPTTAAKFGPVERLVEVFAAIHHVDSFLLNQLREVFRKLDTTGCGSVGEEELRVALGEEQKNVDVAAILNSLCSLYHKDHFTFEEFVVSVTEMRGTSLRITKQVRKLPGLACVASALDVRQYGHRGFTVRGNPEVIRSRMLKGREDQVNVFFTPMQGHFEYLKGTYYKNGEDQQHGAAHSCVITVALTKAVRGYTKVIPSRVSGPTLDYHNSFTCLMAFLEEERNQADDDTETVGDSELI
jgi:serine/threonine protein kinase